MHVQIAYKTHMTSTATDKFPILAPPAARMYQNFPHLSHHLVSVGQLCDANLNVSFDAQSVYVTNNATGKIIIRDHHHLTLRLYEIPLGPDPNLLPRVPHVTFPRVTQHNASSAYEIQPVESTINFLHCACLSTPISVWIKAVICGYFAM